MTVADFVTQFIEPNTSYMIEVNFTDGCSTFVKDIQCNRGSELSDPFKAFLLTLQVEYIDVAKSYEYDYVPLITVKERVSYNILGKNL